MNRGEEIVGTSKKGRVLFVVPVDWALVSHRLHLVEEAVSAGYRVCVFTRITNYRGLIEKTGAEIVDWSISRGSMNLKQEIGSCISLWKVIKSFAPDVVHCVAIKPVIYSGIVCLFYQRIRLCMALGGLGFVFHSKSLLAKLLRAVIVCILGFVSIGKSKVFILQNIEDFHQLGSYWVLKFAKIVLIEGAGVETNKFFPVTYPETTTVLLAARLLWSKGIAEFVEAAGIVRSYNKEVKFVVVGDPDPHNPDSISEQQIELWERLGTVTFKRRVEHEDMPKIIKDSSIICLPSYHEGLPKILLEAAAMGRPIVAFDVQGCRDIIIDGHNGKLAEPRSPASLAKAIDMISKEKTVISKLGLNGANLVKERFSAAIINKKTMDLWMKD